MKLKSPRGSFDRPPKAGDVMHRPEEALTQFVPERDISPEYRKTWSRIWHVLETAEAPDYELIDLLPAVSARVILFPEQRAQFGTAQLNVLKATIAHLRESTAPYEHLPEALIHSWIIFPEAIRDLVKHDEGLKKKLQVMMHNFLNEPRRHGGFDSGQTARILLMRRALFPEMQTPCLVEDSLKKKLTGQISAGARVYWGGLAKAAAQVRLLSESWFKDLAISPADIAHIKAEWLGIKNQPVINLDVFRAWSIAADLVILESQSAEITPHGLRLTPKPRLLSATSLPDRSNM